MKTRTQLVKAGEKLMATEARFGRTITPRDGTPQEKLITRIGKMGDQPELRTLSGAVIAVGLATLNRRLIRAGVRMLLAHELATLGKALIKRRIDRTRPHSAATHAERKVKLGGSTAKEKTSFPSGHSAGALAVARAFSREYPEHRAAALGAASLVAAAQVPRLTHYPTDVAGGLLLGAAAEAAAHRIIGAGAPDA